MSFSIGFYLNQQSKIYAKIVTEESSGISTADQSPSGPNLIDPWSESKNLIYIIHHWNSSRSQASLNSEIVRITLTDLTTRNIEVALKHLSRNFTCRYNVIVRSFITNWCRTSTSRFGGISQSYNSNLIYYLKSYEAWLTFPVTLYS